jgi:DNA modification methylase
VEDRILLGDNLPLLRAEPDGCATLAYLDPPFNTGRPSSAARSPPSRTRTATAKRPSDTWWHTIVSPTGREKTGYPTQKPEGIVRRMVQASSRPGDLCVDPFAGSGTLGAVARQLGRRYLLIDESPEAVCVMESRLGQKAASASPSGVEGASAA